MPEIRLQPTKKQHLAFQLMNNNYTRYLLFGGGAGGGKSWFGCEYILTTCYLHPGTKWFIGRKERTRLMASTFLTWRKVCTHHKIPTSDWKYNEKYNYIEFIAGSARGSRIDLLDLAYYPADPLYERFGSLEFTGGWIEEGGEVEFMCFDVLKSRIGRHLNKELSIPPKLLITCNPTQNWLYRVFYKPFKENRLPEDYAFVQSLYMDNPHTAESYHEQLSSIDDPVLRARLKEGLWEYSFDDLALFKYDAILDLFVNEVEKKPERYFTADIARFGADKLVYTVWQGWEVLEIIIKQKQSLANTLEDIRSILHNKRISYANAIVDEDGIGGGIVDNLVGINGFVGNRAPISKPEEVINVPYSNMSSTYYTRKNYKNLRAQCFFTFADKVNSRQISITAPLLERHRNEIVEELQQIKRVDVSASDAPLQIVPKDEIKESLGRSPDFADALSMRMFFELVKEKPPEGIYRPPDVEKLKSLGVTEPFGGVPWYM